MDINGYEGLYTIDRDGTIKNKKGLIMKIYVERDGYLRIGLTKNNKKFRYSHHRLIAQHFIPNPNNYEQVDHINQIKDDNRIENLRWISMSGNMRNRTITVNKYGLPRGVFKSQYNTYNVKIKIDGKKYHLGSFENIEEASKCYEDKYTELMKIF